MANINEIVNKAVETAGVVADRSAEYAKVAAGKTMDAAQIAKLTAEINSEKSGIKKIYSQIGELYYQLHSEDPEDALAQAVAEISGAFERIADNQIRINNIKAKVYTVQKKTPAREDHEIINPEDQPCTPAEDSGEDAAKEPESDSPDGESSMESECEVSVNEATEEPEKSQESGATADTAEASDGAEK